MFKTTFLNKLKGLLYQRKKTHSQYHIALTLRNLRCQQDPSTCIFFHKCAFFCCLFFFSIHSIATIQNFIFLIILCFPFHIQLLLVCPLSSLHIYKKKKKNQHFTCIFPNITRCCEIIFYLKYKFHFGLHRRRDVVHSSYLSYLRKVISTII